MYSDAPSGEGDDNERESSIDAPPHACQSTLYPRRMMPRAGALPKFYPDSKLALQMQLFEGGEAKEHHGRGRRVT